MQQRCAARGGLGALYHLNDVDSNKSNCPKFGKSSLFYNGCIEPRGSVLVFGTAPMCVHAHQIRTGFLLRREKSAKCSQQQASRRDKVCIIHLNAKTSS